MTKLKTNAIFVCRQRYEASVFAVDLAVSPAPLAAVLDALLDDALLDVPSALGAMSALFLASPPVPSVAVPLAESLDAFLLSLMYHPLPLK